MSDLTRATMTVQNTPKVTIAIPAYNEANYIESVIRGFLTQNHPNLLEVIVADGGSNDGTQEIIKKIALEDSRVKLLNNPLKIQSAGLNLILEHCKGDVFLRADAHSEYASDYIQKCIDALHHSKALNVGGSQRHVAKNTFQTGVVIAFRSFLAGTAKFHNPDYNGYADTVYLGCFSKQALLDVAASVSNKEAFDTAQVANEDAGLNLKLLDVSEKAIYLSSEIRVYYYPRSNWKKLFIQYFKYGRGRYLTTLKHPKNAPLRSKLPVFLLMVYLVLLSFVVALNHTFIFLLLSFFVIFLLFLFETIRVFIRYFPFFEDEIWRGKKNELPNPIFIFLSCLVALIIMPASYLAGNIYQRYRTVVLKVKGW